MIYFKTIKEIRDEYEHGVEALIGRSVGDIELIDFLKTEANMEIEWDDKFGKYRVIKEK